MLSGGVDEAKDPKKVSAKYAMQRKKRPVMASLNRCLSLQG